MIAVDASRYAVISHGRLCMSSKSRPIVGSAVARMVWSSDPMNVGSSTPKTISSACRCVRALASRRSAYASIGERGPVPVLRAIGACAVTLAAGCKARLPARPAAPGHRQDVEAACGGVASAVVPFCCSAPKCASGGVADISLPAAGLARNCQSAQLLGIAAATAWTISFERLESPWRSFRREGTLPAEARAMALNQVTLDDKFDLAKSRIFVTGFQAIVRLCLMQKE